MNKLWLIIQREYLTRVKKRSFIIATLITPIAMGLFIVLVTYIVSYEGGESLDIAVIDKAGVLDQSELPSDQGMYFSKVREPLETVKSKVKEGKYSGVL